MHRREFITVPAALRAAGGTHALEPARVVSHGFGMGDREPGQRVQVAANAVLLRCIPAKS
jgi:hypothetical protein